MKPIEKTRVTIAAIDPNGVPACITLETDAPWLAMSIEDIPKMENFRPSKVLHMEMSGKGYVYDSQFGPMVWRS